MPITVGQSVLWRKERAIVIAHEKQPDGKWIVKLADGSLSCVALHPNALRQQWNEEDATSIVVADEHGNISRSSGAHVRIAVV